MPAWALRSLQAGSKEAEHSSLCPQWILEADWPFSQHFWGSFSVPTGPYSASPPRSGGRRRKPWVALSISRLQSKQIFTPPECV